MLTRTFFFLKARIELLITSSFLKSRLNSYKISLRTIDRIKKRFLEDGLDDSLERKPTSRVYEKKIDGDVEANLVKLCCSNPPDGFAKWSLRLLADKLVELEYIDSISHVSVGNLLKKMNLSLGE
ncbi:helix-turn-helix domain-containing protein [Polaribacter sp. IC066]|nr:helix-turn-helix domain-containing protein [Polaribacter sp. IC063]TXD58252.1 helix-turn-helix domain-containing protein [Polaribacter sp. IC066]